jgi:hypothetical protein
MSSKVSAIINGTKNILKSPIFWDITPCSALNVDGVMSQKTVLFITTATRTSNPTNKNYITFFFFFFFFFFF